MDGFFDDDLIRSVLGGVRTIAVVGASPNPARPSALRGNPPPFT